MWFQPRTRSPRNGEIQSRFNSEHDLVHQASPHCNTTMFSQFPKASGPRRFRPLLISHQIKLKGHRNNHRLLQQLKLNQGSTLRWAPLPSDFFHLRQLGIQSSFSHCKSSFAASALTFMGVMQEHSPSPWTSVIVVKLATADLVQSHVRVRQIAVLLGLSMSSTGAKNSVSEITSTQV